MENGHINTKCTKQLQHLGLWRHIKIITYENSLMMVISETEDNDLNIYVVVNTN
jgi:hypothetical protein